MADASRLVTLDQSGSTRVSLRLSDDHHAVLRSRGRRTRAYGRVDAACSFVLSVLVQMLEQIVQALAVEIADGERPPGSALPSIRLFARERGCAPGTVARAYEELKRAGLIVARDRARARVARDAGRRARQLLGGGVRPLRLAGSDDPALDALLRQVGSAVELTVGPRGSVHGLAQVARGAAQAAAIHLLHIDSDRYNDPYVRLLLAGEPIALVHLWRREVGLVVAAGNPRGIERVDDLEELRIAWRAPGTGSRLALERLLRSARVEPRPELGEPCESHFAVAATVAAGAADAGLAVRAAAAACELEFIPLAVEPFEVAFREDALDALAPMLDTLAQREVASRIASLGGYDLADAGQIRRAA
jgi:molybdate-binding protein